MDSLIRVEFKNGKLKNLSAFAVSGDEIAWICVNFELDMITENLIKANFEQKCTNTDTDVYPLTS